MVNPLEILLSSPWFWIVLILVILIVAFRAQLARLIDRAQNAQVEASKEGFKVKFASTQLTTEKPHDVPPPLAATPTQSVQVGQDAVIKDSTFGDIGNVIIKTSPAPAPAKIPSAPISGLASRWNTAAIRELLTAAFNDDELTTLCFDYFPPVYQELTSGMTTGQKIQRLFDYCQRRDQFDALLALVHERNPVQYARFEGRLRG